uniref:Uncharacterized protein n=1 Tax=Anopheles aquasalis TaxID=42839 RepID=T1E952_ANOAQ
MGWILKTLAYWLVNSIFTFPPFLHPAVRGLPKGANFFSFFCFCCCAVATCLMLIVSSRLYRYIYIYRCSVTVIYASLKNINKSQPNDTKEGFRTHLHTHQLSPPF